MVMNMVKEGDEFPEPPKLKAGQIVKAAARPLLVNRKTVADRAMQSAMALQALLAAGIPVPPKPPPAVTAQTCAPADVEQIEHSMFRPRPYRWPASGTVPPATLDPGTTRVRGSVARGSPAKAKWVPKTPAKDEGPGKVDAVLEE